MKWTDLAERVRQAREAQGLSQDDLATMAEAGKATISRIETLTGSAADPIPRIDTLERVVTALGIGPLSRFLADFEDSGLTSEGAPGPIASHKKNVVTEPVTDGVEDSAVTAPSSLSVVRGPSHGSSPSGFVIPDLSAEEARFLQRLGLVIAGVANAALVSGANQRTTGDGQQSRTGTHPLRRSTDENGGGLT